MGRTCWFKPYPPAEQSQESKTSKPALYSLVHSRGAENTPFGMRETCAQEHMMRFQPDFDQDHDNDQYDQPQFDNSTYGEDRGFIPPPSPSPPTSPLPELRIPHWVLRLWLWGCVDAAFPNLGFIDTLALSYVISWVASCLLARGQKLNIIRGVCVLLFFGVVGLFVGRKFCEVEKEMWERKRAEAENKEFWDGVGRRAGHVGQVVGRVRGGWW